MIFRAVVFDLDGTLLDSLQDIAAAANRALQDEGLPTYDLAAYRYLVGEGVRVLMERAIPPALRTSQQVERCIERFGLYYGESWNVHTRPYPGITALLAALQQRRIATAVLSNKPHEFTQKCVHYFFPEHSFDIVLGYREHIPRKPDPAAAQEICRYLGLSPGEVIFLGDTCIDIQTARAAGMYAVGATWGFRDEQELRAAGAQRIIAAPEELLAVLDHAPRG